MRSPCLSSPLESEEVRRISHLCRHVVIAEMPTDALQMFLVRRLQETAPELAARVAGLSAEEIGQLRQELAGTSGGTWRDSLWS
jgi:hypothetical protein